MLDTAGRPRVSCVNEVPEVPDSVFVLVDEGGRAVVSVDALVRVELALTPRPIRASTRARVASCSRSQHSIIFWPEPTVETARTSNRLEA